MIKRGLNQRLAEVGKIKTGYKGKEVTSKNGKKFRPPKKIDWFVITSTERNEAGDLIQNEKIMEKLGERPKELKIRLPFDSVDKNFFTQYQAYANSKKVCSGDGIEAERVGAVKIGKSGYIEQSGEGKAAIKCDPETCPIYQAGKCKVSGILSVFLPEADDLGGVYKYRTHSYNGVSSILAALEYFADNTGGILQGLPLKLVMVKKTTADHGTINYATVVIDGEELHGLRTLALEEKNSRLMLGTDIKKVEESAEKAGFFKDSDPENEIEAEYYVQEEEAPQEADAINAELTAEVEPKPEKTETKVSTKKELF